MKNFLILLLLLPLFGNAQITLYGRFPTEPVNYVTDQAGVLAQNEEDLLNTKARNFEDSTSNQLFIYIAESLRANDLEDFSKEIFNQWGIGQKDKNNGILIAIFIKDRKYRIQIGYGLEAALPSDLCKQIQDEDMGPHFKEKDFYEGINAGLDKLIYYSRHEYKPPSALEQMQTPLVVAFLIGLVLFIINLFSLKKWSNQPKRKRKYLLLGILFLVCPIFIIIVFTFFKIESSFVLVPTFLGTFAELLLCTVINDKDDIRYDHETDDAYQRRMYNRAISADSSSDDSSGSGGGGSSGSGGSSSSW